MKQLTDEVFAQVREALEIANANNRRNQWSTLLTDAALAALDTAQPEPVNAMLVEALQAAEKLEHEALVALSEATYELKVGNPYTTATDTYKAHNDLIHRLDKILNSQYRDRKRTALTAAQQAQPALSGCACRWDADDNRVATCIRHQGWLDVVSEWADRAKAAEAKQAQPERAPITDEYLESLQDKDFRFSHAIKQGGQHD